LNDGRFKLHSYVLYLGSGRGVCQSYSATEGWRKAKPIPALYSDAGVFEVPEQDPSYSTLAMDGYSEKIYSPLTTVLSGRSLGGLTYDSRNSMKQLRAAGEFQVEAGLFWIKMAPTEGFRLEEESDNGEHSSDWPC